MYSKWERLAAVRKRDIEAVKMVQDTGSEEGIWRNERISMLLSMVSGYDLRKIYSNFEHS